MQSSSRKIVTGSTVFTATMIIAVVGYWMAGWSFSDACYMVIITISGVGYGEVRPVEGTPLRIFTILFIISGCTSAVFVMGGFVQMIAEGEINKALGARRMTDSIKRLKQHAILCGFGRVGQILAAELKEARIPFVVVDQSADRIREAEQLGYLVYLGDATEEETLSAVGIHDAKVLATVLPNDALNVFITLSARELSDSIEIVARGESASTKRKLLSSGANEVVMPAAVGAAKIAQLISRPPTSSILQNPEFESRLNEDLSMLGVKLQEVTAAPNSQLINLSIGDLEKRTSRGVVIVAVRRRDGTELTALDKDIRILEGDALIFIGHAESLLTLGRYSASQSIIYRGAKSG